MCRKAHLSDIRFALHDYCEDPWQDDESLQLDDLLAQFENPEVDPTRPSRVKRKSSATKKWPAQKSQGRG